MTLPAPHDALITAEPRYIDQVNAPVDRAEVLRYLGYPAEAAPKRWVEEILEIWIAEAGRLAAPRATYLVLPVVAKDGRRLRLQSAWGDVEFRGAIGEFLDASQLVGAFIATAGPKIEAQASELLRQGEALPALVVNAVGAERAEAAEAAVIAQLRNEAARFGFAPTLPYSPGYCGMKLTEQTKLFSLFRDATAGVSLTADCLMRPVKSVSGLIGLGLAERVTAAGSPCDRCELHSCAMRR